MYRTLFISLITVLLAVSSSAAADKTVVIDLTGNHTGNNNSYVDAAVKNFPQLTDVKTNVFHLVSHGRPGELLIDRQWRNAEQIADFLQTMNSETSAANRFTHLYIYGCEFGKTEKGKAAVAFLEKKLGIIVSASDDITGKDGDWELEVGKPVSLKEYNQYNGNLQYGPTDDFDNDGIQNQYDIDDDNDGIPDALESPSCFYTADEWNTMAKPSNAVSITSALTTTTSNFSQLLDGISNVSALTFSSSPTQAIQNVNVYLFTFSSPVRLDALYLKFNTTTQFGGATKIQGSNTNNGTDWADLSAGISTVTTNTTVNGSVSVTTSIKYPVTLNTTTAYKYIRITGAVASNIAAQNASEVYFDFNTAAYVTSFYPKASCTDANIDGDNILPQFDLDSDGDGCSDAFEAGATTNTAANFQFTGTDANGNGLVDSKENGTTGFTNYASTYTQFATSATFRSCIDTDGDGILDVTDIDDDNDGILDFIESQCTAPVYTSKTGVTVSSSLTWNSGSLSTLVDGADVTNQTYPTAASIAGQTVLEFDFPASHALKQIELTAYSTQTAIVVGAVIQMQGWNGSSWVNIGSQITVTTPTTSIANPAQLSYQFSMTNTFPYTKYRIQGVSGNVQANWLQEAYFSELCLQLDTDGDGIPNRLDLDSDGDGCPDALEAGVSTNSGASGSMSASGGAIYSGGIAPGTANAYVGTGAAAQYDANGFFNGIETGSESGIYNGTYTYQYATGSNYAPCRDTDGDGINDITDIDDDNDGIVDAVESPACFYSAVEMAVPSSVTSQIPYTQNISNLYDNLTNTTFAFTSTTAVNALGKAIVEITPVYPQAATGIAFFLSTATSPIGALSATATLRAEGWNGTSWVTLATYTSTPAVSSNKQTFAFTNTTTYSKYRLFESGANGVAISTNAIQEVSLVMPAGYVPSANPKLTCARDTDSDGVPNHQDLDSDGDGCSDLKEAGVSPSADISTPASTTNNAGTSYGIAAASLGNSQLNPAATDANNDGLNDSVDPGLDGQADYVSTYRYAISAVANYCRDTDGDGIPDLTDIDDDNDGIPDVVENNCGVILNHYNVIVNGDFSNGTSGFYSELDMYDATIGASYASYNGVNGYTATWNPYPANGTRPADPTNNYISTNDIADPGISGISPIVVWEQTITLPPNGDFIWRMDMTTSGVMLDFQLDGVSLVAGPKAYNSTNGYSNGTWRKTDIPFNSGSGVITLRILQYATGSAGAGDMGIDNIEINSYCQYDVDTDGDGIPNHLDLDSDGDGCPDLKEASVNPLTDVFTPSSATNNYGTSYGISIADISNSQLNPAGTDANKDGLNDSVDPDLNSQVNYTSTYNLYAVVKNWNFCNDKDGDGILDLDDIDDDNDGILDAVESPTCFYTSAEMAVPSAVSTEIPTSGDISTVYDNTPSTTFAFTATTAVNAQNKTIFEITPQSPVQATAIVINYSATTGNALGTAANSVSIDGWDGMTWVTLATLTPAAASSNLQTLSIPAANQGVYRKYRLYDLNAAISTAAIREITLGLPASYNPSAHPKTTCNNDTDGNGIPNHQDLDSDGDGCSDAFETGITGILLPAFIVNNSGVYYTPRAVAKGPYGINGFANPLETSTSPESGVYTGSYTSYGNAINSSMHNCTVAPQAKPDVNITYVNTQASGNLSVNDIVAAGSTYGSVTTVPGYTNPGTETPVVNSDGTYTFTAATTGVYQFYVSVCPPSVSTDCQQVLLTIEVLNAYVQTNKPVANPDFGTTKRNGTVTLKTLANDRSGNNYTTLQPSTVTITAAPKNGVATVNATTGDITYTAATGFIGQDTLTYSVCDDASPSPNCNTSYQIITVLPLSAFNSVTASDDYLFVPQGTTGSGNVLNNDYDPDGNTITVEAQNISIPGKGIFILQTNGSYTFEAESSFTGAVNFPYKITDNGSPTASAWATVYILVPSVSALPLDLLTFTAVKENGNTVGLNWTTTNEINSSHFNIERMNGSGQWEPIGTVQATGNGSTSVNSYYFQDRQPLNGTNYYRLKQVDNDGTFKYSPTRLVSFRGTGALMVYPNPADDYVIIKSTALLPNSLHIYDALGQQLDGMVQVEQVSPQQLKVQLYRLTPGMYIIKVNGYIVKFIKK